MTSADHRFTRVSESGGSPEPGLTTAHESLLTAGQGTYVLADAREVGSNSAPDVRLGGESARVDQVVSPVIAGVNFHPGCDPHHAPDIHFLPATSLANSSAHRSRMICP